MSLIPTGNDLNYEYIYKQEHLDRIIQWLKGRTYFICDTETTGLNPLTDKIVILQIGDKDKQWLIDVRSVDVSPLRRYFKDPTIRKVGHHYIYDIEMMQSNFGWISQNSMCTEVNERVIRCGLSLGKGSYSLAGVVKHYLNVTLDKDEDVRTGWGDIAVGKFAKRSLDYAAYDVIYPDYVGRHQKPIIDKRGLRNTVTLENDYLPALADMELQGMRLDKDAWVSLYQEALQKRSEEEAKLDEFFGTQTLKQEDMFVSAKSYKTINYASWQQIIAALKRKGYITKSTDSKTITLAALDGQLPMEFVRPMVAYRIYNTRVTRYGLNFLGAIEESTQHLHSDFTQVFTNTGRLSSGNKKSDHQPDDKTTKEYKVNMQNIPKISAYRNCFIPDEGDVFIIFDLQAIEPRILGDMSLDPMYIKTFTEGTDIYSNIGWDIYNEEVSKSPGRPSELRDKTKIGLLGTSYGTGKNKFYERMRLDLNSDSEGFIHSNIVKVSREESDELWDGIFKACPEIRGTLDRFSDMANPLESKRVFYDDRAAALPVAKAREKSMECLQPQVDEGRLTEQDAKDQADNMARRRAWVTFSTSQNGRKRLFRVYHKSWWTDGRNHPIQSTAADILKTAALDVYKFIIDNDYDANVINQVHDELILRCKKEQAEELSPHIKRIMEEAGNKFLRLVPCVAEGGIKHCWDKD